MKAFFVRHGHTFGPEQPGGEKIIMCGSGQNLPLVARGRQAARRFAQKLLQENTIPKAIYANELLRTWEHASIIREHILLAREIEVPIILDDHLLELDYGAWAGLGSDGEDENSNEIIQRFGLTAWQDWQQRRIIPNHAPHNWQVTKQEIVTRLRQFADVLVTQYQADDTVVVMGSQGSLTFLNELLPGGMQQGIANDHYKIKPGNFIEMEYQDSWQLQQWNVVP